MIVLFYVMAFPFASSQRKYSPTTTVENIILQFYRCFPPIKGGKHNSPVSFWLKANSNSNLQQSK